MKKNKQAEAKTKSEAIKSIGEHEPDSAGIDLGANEIWVAVPADRDQKPVRQFGAFTRDLLAIVEWLVQLGVRSVAMESTGVYWIPLYQLLEEAGLKVCLVNARHVKNVPGRKSDVRDCQWLQYLHSVGLLLGSFRPAQAICASRSIYRYRQNLLSMAAQHVQHMQAALDQMNIKLHHVIDDLTGVTGQAIVAAILKGQRDPVQLAQLGDKRIKASEATIAKALEGDWRKEHLFVLEKARAQYQEVQKQIQDCDQELWNYTRQLEACTRVIKPAKVMRLNPQLVGTEPLSNPPTKKRVRTKTSKNQPEGPWQLELEKSYAAAPAAAKIESAKPCAWRPLPYTTTKATSAINTGACAPDWELPKPLQPWPTNWLESFGPSLPANCPLIPMSFAYHEKAHQQRRLKHLAASARQMGYQLTPVAT
jgi:transposase